MLRIDVRTDLPDVFRLIEKLEPARLDAVLKNIGEEGVGLARESFQQSVEPDGKTKWKPLAETTLEALVGIGGLKGRRRRKDYGTRPLVRTATLMNSLNWQLKDGGVAIGASASYAVYHQGDPDHQDKAIVPRRRFLPERELPDRWRNAVLEAVEGFLEEEGN